MGKLYLTGFYWIITLLLFSSCRQEEPVLPARHPAKEQTHITAFWDGHTDMDSLDLEARVLRHYGYTDSAKWLWLQVASQMNFYSGGRALVYKRLGELYYDEDNCDSALFYFHNSLMDVGSHRKTEGFKASIYGSMGGVYFLKKQFDSAVLYLYSGLLMIHSTTHNVNYRDAYTVYDNLAWFLFNMKQPDMAQLYLKEARKLAGQNKDTGYVMKALAGEAMIYVEKGQINKAIKLYETIIGSRNAGYDTRLTAYGSLGLIYASSKLSNQKERAFYYLDKGLESINGHSAAESQESWLLHNFGVAYITMAQQSGQRVYFKKAKSIYKKIEEMGNISRFSFGGLRTFYRNYAIACYSLGQYREAADLYRKSLAAQDREYGANALSQINQSELQYRTAAKDKLIAQNKLQLAEQENKIQRQYLWIGGITSGAMIITLLFVVAWRRKQHQTELARLKDVMAGEERERVRIARDLHDGIVSQLSAIKINFSNLPVLHPDMNDATDDFHQALLQLEQSITELRNTSHNLLPEILQREGLVAAINIYCREISRMTPCAVAFQVLGGLPGLKEEFQLGVYRIIQELLQNIVKHAGATDALLQFNVEQGMFDITVDDNGCGLQASPLPGIPGVGLSNIQQRVTALGGRMEIETGEGRGTSVYLSFDLKDYIEKT